MITRPSKFSLLLVISLSLLTGCSYRTNLARQAQLDTAMAQYRSVMQTAGSNATPATFKICDDKRYPCSLITPIHFIPTTFNQALTPTVLAVRDTPEHTSLYYHSMRKSLCTH